MSDSVCDPIDGSPPGSPVPGILQTRTLEWVAISFSNAWKWKVKVTPWTAAHQAPPSLGFSRQEHWSGLPFPSPMYESEKWKWPHGLQPTRLLHPWIFQARVLEWGAIAFSASSVQKLGTDLLRYIQFLWYFLLQLAFTLNALPNAPLFSPRQSSLILLWIVCPILKLCQEIFVG